MMVVSFYEGLNFLVVLPRQLQCIPRAFAHKWRTGIQFYFAKYETGFQALLRQLDGGDVNEDM